MKKLIIPFAILGYALLIIIVAPILIIEAYCTGNSFEDIHNY